MCNSALNAEHSLEFYFPSINHPNDKYLETLSFAYRCYYRQPPINIIIWCTNNRVLCEFVLQLC